MHKLEDEHKLEHQHEEEACTCDCCAHDHDDDCCKHEEEHEHHHHDLCDCGCCDDDDDDCCDDDCGCGHEHHHHEHEHHVERVHSGNSKVYILQNLGCAHCAAKMEDKINELSGVTAATITYTTKQLRLSAADPDKYLPEVQKICASIESEVTVVPRDTLEKEKKQKQTEGHSHEEEGDDKKELACIISGAVLFAIGIILNHTIDNALAAFTIFAVAYIILGGEILVKAVKNISHGQVFDENFLIRYEIYNFRTHINGIHNLTTAAFHCFILEKFTDAVEKHNTDSFWKITDCKRGKSSHTHQEIFIKYLSVRNIFNSFHQNFSAQNDISNSKNGR